MLTQACWLPFTYPTLCFKDIRVSPIQTDPLLGLRGIKQKGGWEREEKGWKMKGRGRSEKKKKKRRGRRDRFRGMKERERERKRKRKEGRVYGLEGAEVVPHSLFHNLNTNE